MKRKDGAPTDSRPQITWMGSLYSPSTCRYSRTFVITGIPKEHETDLDQIEITVNYTGDSDIHKANALDTHVIPAIKAAFPKDMDLDEAKLNHLQQWKESVVANGGFSPSEADDALNTSSLDVIRAMEAEHGEAWLVKINLYDDDCTPLIRAVTDRNADGYNCYNFCCSLVVPRYDEKLKQMILERKFAPYTGTKADSERINAIDDYAETLGAVRLCWS